jgi:transposase
MTRVSAERRDFVAMQQRRRTAVRLFAAGRLSQAEIARELQVSRRSVSRWCEAWRSDRPRWICASRAGRDPRLDEAQLQKVDEALRRGALAHGFPTNLWTVSQIATVIERITGVHYHLGHVWEVLAALEWSLLRPDRQARERNQEARQRWVAKRWPAVKQTRRGEKPGFSSRTKAEFRSGTR